MRSIAILFSLLFACGLAPSLAVAEACSTQRHIVLLDRTSVMNDVEIASFQRGVEVLVQQKGIEGTVEVLEINDTSAGFVSVLEECIAFQLDLMEGCEVPEQENQGVLSQILDFLFPPQSTPNDEILSAVCRQETIANEEFERSSRMSAVNKIVAVLSTRNQTSDTALLETIAEILASRCKNMECDLHIFSNLIDTRTKSIDDGEPYSDLGNTEMKVALEERGFTRKISSVEVWGFGFDDRDGGRKRELSDEQRSLLINYWRGAFSAFSDTFVPIGRDLEL